MSRRRSLRVALVLLPFVRLVRVPLPRFCRTNTYDHFLRSLIKNTASSLFPKNKIPLRMSSTGKAEQRQIATEQGDGNDC